MKRQVLLICIFISSFGYGQNKKVTKWYSNAEIDVIIHNKTKYSYSYFGTDNTKHIIWDEDLNVKKPAIGLTYSYNYMLFKKLSIGLISGYKKYNQPDFSMAEIGGVVKFFFVDTDNVFVYCSLTNEISLNKEQFKSGTNARLGIGVPVIKRNKFNVAINLFTEQHFLRLEGADPILNYQQEKYRDLLFKSSCISNGIKF